jgi:hypothetical protein
MATKLVNRVLNYANAEEVLKKNLQAQGIRMYQSLNLIKPGFFSE